MSLDAFQKKWKVWPVPRKPTPTHRLANVLLGRPLEEWVREQRAAGTSWRLLSMELWATTDRQVLVSFETLRSWFPDDGDNGDEAAA